MSFLNSFRIFDFCITVVALMANCVALIALTRSRFNLIGYRSFLMSLTAGNLFTCLLGITIMAYDASVFSSHHRDDLVSGNVTGGSNSALGYNSWLGHESFDDVAALCASSMLRSLKLASFIINLLNLWGMSIDHLLGIGFPIKYQSIMTKVTVRIAVGGIWIASFMIGFLDIPINAIFHSYADRPDMSIQPELQELGLTPLGSSNMTIFQLEDTFGSFNLSEIEKLLDERFLSDNSSTLAPLDSDTNGNVSDYSETLKQLFDILAPPPELGVQQKLCASPLRISNIWLEMSVIVLTFCSLLVMAFCYTIILRKVSSRMDAQSRQSKKLIITTLIFVGAFVICWLPCMLFELSMVIGFFLSSHPVKMLDPQTEERLMIVEAVVNSVLMLCPLIDPIIYVWRIPTVQRSMLMTLAQVCPCLRDRYLAATEHKRSTMSAVRSNSMPMMVRTSTSVSGQTTSNANQNRCSAPLCTGTDSSTPLHTAATAQCQIHYQVKMNGHVHDADLDPEITELMPHDDCSSHYDNEDAFDNS